MHWVALKGTVSYWLSLKEQIFTVENIKLRSDENKHSRSSLAVSCFLVVFPQKETLTVFVCSYLGEIVLERDRIIPNFSRRLKVRKYKELYMFGRIGGGANFHMESGVGGGETMYPEKR